MKVVEAKELWLSIINEVFPTSTWEQIDVSYIIRKLKRIRFTYNGVIRTHTDKRLIRPDKVYIYVSYHFPSLIKEYNRKRLDILEEENS